MVNLSPSLSPSLNANRFKSRSGEDDMKMNNKFCTLTWGRIQMTFFFLVKVRGVGGKSTSSCRPPLLMPPFTTMPLPRDKTPFNCLPCIEDDPLDWFMTSVDERGREMVEIWSYDVWRHGLVKPLPGWYWFMLLLWRYLRAPSVGCKIRLMWNQFSLYYIVLCYLKMFMISIFNSSLVFSTLMEQWLNVQLSCREL